MGQKKFQVIGKIFEKTSGVSIPCSLVQHAYQFYYI